MKNNPVIKFCFDWQVSGDVRVFLRLFDRHHAHCLRKSSNSLPVLKYCFGLQVSSDVRMLLPLLVGIMVAKWVADALTHPLYHGLLEIKCIPFLSSEPISIKHLDLLPVARVMASPVVTLCERDRLGTVFEALRHTQHNGFPIVRASPHGQVGGQCFQHSTMCLASLCHPSTIAVMHSRCQFGLCST